MLSLYLSGNNFSEMEWLNKLDINHLGYLELLSSICDKLTIRHYSLLIKLLTKSACEITLDKFTICAKGIERLSTTSSREVLLRTCENSINNYRDTIEFIKNPKGINCECTSCISQRGIDYA